MSFVSESIPKNEMEVLAEASFWITDIVKGKIGKFSVEEKGWGEGDYERTRQEVLECLTKLREAGFKDDKKAARYAPYTPNISVGCFKKKIEGLGNRWVTMILQNRFGLKVDFQSFDYQPWPG